MRLTNCCRCRHFVALGVLSAIWLPQAQSAAPAGFQQPVLIRFEGEINPMMEQYFNRKLEAARERGADLVIVEIDSPGGRLDSSLNLASTLRDTEWAHTVAYVPREAISGGAIMALGCDEIVMHPFAKLGDAGPIYMDEGFMFQHASEKIRTELARSVRDLATATNRPPALAEAMVDDGLVVFRVRDKQDDTIHFMTESEIKSSPEPDRWEQLNPVLETRDDKFLHVNGNRAVELQLASVAVEDRDALQEHLGWQGELVEYDRTTVDQAVFVLNHWLITGLLVVVGIVALFVEFSAPGISIGGLLAGLCFSLFFWSRFLGGTAVWLEVLLFIAGLVFLLVELLILPGFGIAGLAGLLLIGASLILASQTFVVPHNTAELGVSATSFITLIVSGICVIVVVYFITSHLGRIPLLNKLSLDPPEPAPPPQNHEQRTASSSSSSHTWSGLQVGDVGQARSALRPAGQCEFGDLKVDVVTDGRFIEPGTAVQITEISGNRVMVKQVQNS